MTGKCKAYTDGRLTVTQHNGVIIKILMTVLSMFYKTSSYLGLTLVCHFGFKDLSQMCGEKEQLRLPLESKHSHIQMRLFGLFIVQRYRMIVYFLHMNSSGELKPYMTIPGL